MADERTTLLTPIAMIHNDYDGNFGIPRQAGLVPEVVSTVVFEPPYRAAEALRGIEEFDYLWIVWQFSGHIGADGVAKWRPTVRPPRLGGNRRMGVFATRSPFRPNALGLSSVRLLRVEWSTAQGPVLYVSGADMMNGTPVFDIKPYLPYADGHPGARGGFAVAPPSLLEVQCDEAWLAPFDTSRRNGLLHLLALDPRPSYSHDAEKEYLLSFAGHDIRFRVCDGVLTVTAVFATPQTS